MSEQNQKYFRGWFIPQGVVDLFDMGEISPMELILLATIESLVKDETQGCFASNAYLAERCKVKTRWLIATVTRLTEVGLIVKRGGEGERRELFTAFSHVKLSKRGVHYSAPGALQCTGAVHSSAPPFSGDTVSTSLNKQERQIGAFGVLPEKTFEQIAASRLEQVLRKHRRVTGQVKPKVWQAAISDLLKKGRTKDEVKRVIKFLEVDEYFRAKYTPPVFSAASFKHKFDGLLAAVERTTPQIEMLVTSKDEAFILGMLEPLAWPKGSQGQLHAVLRKSIESFEPWFKKLRALEKELDPEDGLVGFVERQLAGTYYGGSRTYLLNWFRHVNAVVTKWKDWSGNLSQYEWTPRHKLHVTMLEEQSSQYAAHTKYAHSLLESLE